MRLLSVDDKFEVIIPGETLEIPEFKAVVNRIKKMKGDADGRLKLVAKKELAFIYHMKSNDGPYSSYEEKERFIRLTNDLFEDKDWTPDEVVKKAMDKFEELNKTPSSKFIHTTLNMLHRTNAIVDAMINQLEENLVEGKFKVNVITKSGIVKTGVQIMMDDIAALTKAGNEIPKTIETLEKLEEKILKERQEKASRVKGGITISDRSR